MKIQTKRHRAQCLIYAFATVLDIDAETLIDLVGHDGTEIVFPGYKVPLCCRGHHPAELTYVCDCLGYTCYEYPFVLRIGRSPDTVISVTKNYSIETLLLNSSGVLLTAGHAYAWDHTKCRLIDPDTSQITYMKPSEITQSDIYKTFFAVSKR